MSISLKELYVDMDGVVASIGLNKINGFNEYNDFNFYHKKPVLDMIAVINLLHIKGIEIKILSVGKTHDIGKAKIHWIKEHMPFVKEYNIHIVGNREDKNKYLRILHPPREFYPYWEIGLVDDNWQTLREVEDLYTAIHPSALLAEHKDIEYYNY